MSSVASTPHRSAGLMAVLALVRMVLALLHSILEGMEESDPERPMLAQLVAQMTRQEARLLGEIAAVGDEDLCEEAVRLVRPCARPSRGVGGPRPRGWAGAVPGVARAPPGLARGFGVRGDPLRRALSRAYRIAKPASIGPSIAASNVRECR